MKLFLLLSVFCLMFFGVFAFPKTNYQVVKIDDTNGLPDKNVNDFIFDKFGFLWVTTDGSIVRYAYKNSVIFNHHTNPKINSDNFRDLLLIDSTICGVNEIKFLKFDLHGILYLVSRNGLIMLKKKQSFEALMEYETTPGQKIRRGIIEDTVHKRLFFLTYNGVYVYNQKTKRYESYINEIANAYNACIDNTKMYVATEGAGVFSIRLSDLKVEQLYSYKDNGENDISIHKWNDENIMLGWYKGLKLLNLKTRKLQRVELSYKGRIYDDMFVNTILRRNTNEWWIATSKGIFVLNKDLKVIRRYASDESANNKISSDNINTIYFKNDGCLAGLSDDLVFIPFKNGSTESLLYEKNYVVNKIIGILEDKLGRIWLSSYNGIFCMDLKTHTINAYHAPDYFQFDEFNKSSLLRTASGKMFFGTVSEYLNFDPLDYQSDSLIYKLKVNAIKAVDRDLVKTVYNVNEGGLFELPTANSNLNLTFVFQNQFKPEAVRYYYKLEGITDKWVSLENLSTLQLFSLPSGRRKMAFKAVNTYDMSAAETYIMISVPTIFYKTIWFAALIILLLILIGYAIYLNRINNFKKILLLRKEISNELHDSVGTAVTKSILFAESIQRETGSKDSRLQQIIDYGKQVNSSFRDVLWSMETSNDQILNLFDRIHEIGNTSVENTPIEFVILRHNVHDEYTLTTRQKRELLMVTREAIHNVLKHSNGDIIIFEFRKMNGKLNLHIHDNGKNENEDLQFSGMGLESIKMRISKIGGKVTFKKRKDGFDIDINV